MIDGNSESVTSRRAFAEAAAGAAIEIGERLALMQMTSEELLKQVELAAQCDREVHDSFGSWNEMDKVE